MNVTCPNCATTYRVDPAKVPEAGVRARCAVCSAVFAVSREAQPVAAVRAGPGGPAAAPRRRVTLLPRAPSRRQRPRPAPAPTAPGPAPGTHSGGGAACDPPRGRPRRRRFRGPGGSAAGPAGGRCLAPTGATREAGAGARAAHAGTGRAAGRSPPTGPGRRSAGQSVPVPGSVAQGQAARPGPDLGYGGVSPGQTTGRPSGWEPEGALRRRDQEELGGVLGSGGTAAGRVHRLFPGSTERDPGRRPADLLTAAAACEERDGWRPAPVSLLTACVQPLIFPGTSSGRTSMADLTERLTGLQHRVLELRDFL